MKTRKIIFLVLLTLILTACASKSTYATDSMPMKNAGIENVEMSAKQASTSSDSIRVESESERKIIKTFNVSLKCTNLDESMKSFENLLNEYKGYIIYSYIDNNESEYYQNNKYTNLQVRVPTESVEEFVSKLSTVGIIGSKSLNTSDITDNYNQVESRLNALKTQETRLLEIMKEATTVSDLLTIENQLSIVRGDIEYYSMQIATFDKQVDYSLVDVTITETKTGTIQVEEGFFGKLKNTFFESISDLISFVQGFILTAVYLWPIVLILIALIVFIIKKKPNISIFKKRNNSKE